jgi:uncharacterized lipoprotein YddW (UPF0748 family)
MLIPIIPVVAAFQDPAPKIPREFRAVWIATVAHIDWPSPKAVLPYQQRAEMVRILDRAASLKLNTVILQVRPAADAFYKSNIEPWSVYLTGTQGLAPSPLYDPLEFAIEEAHKRGLQIQAWFNPYRAQLLTTKGGLAPNSFARTHPQMVKKYGDLLWMDPGEPEVQARSLAVIEDVVRRYDIDGVHLDDYFYPYPEGGKDFPDDDSYARYGGGLSKLDWRHKNVDEFIARLTRGIHSIKPYIEFGISPFGIYRPGIPAGIKAGVDQYRDLSSDPVKWLQQGWCDYLSPQLYWPIAQKAQSFPVLLNWWRSQNTLHRHLWPGLYTSRVLSSRKGFAPQEIVHQILLTRKRDSDDPGHIHFSMKALTDDAKSIDEFLLAGCYQDYALPPASPWLGEEMAPAPELTLGKTGIASWPENRSTRISNYVVQERFGKRWRFQILPADSSRLQMPLYLDSGRLNRVEIAAVSRTGTIGRYSMREFENSP